MKSKKIISLMLALALMPAILSAAAIPAGGSSDFEISASGALLRYNGPGGHVVIPGDVVSVWATAFKNNETITGVTLPENLTRLTDDVFAGCVNLKSIKIPGKVTSIGQRAFQNCESLTEVILPDSLKTIDSHAFAGCISLVSIEIPDGVIFVGGETFIECTALKNVNIPEGNTKTPGFYSCTSLETVILPSTITHIDNWEFYNCASLKSLILPDGVIEIGMGAFRECTKLESINIPDGVTHIGDDAFHSCHSLKNLILPDSIVSIGADAFRGCRSFESINIPKGLTEIPEGAFMDIDRLKSVTVPGNINTIGKRAFFQDSDLKEVAIMRGVAEIGDEAFQNCYSLESITIPPSVTKIGERVFFDGTELTIYGESGSYAETYAKANNIEFAAVIIPVEPETKTITATFGATKYILNGGNFDEQTMVYNGVAYLPAAYLATKLGLSAIWDSATNTTSLTSTGVAPPAAGSEDSPAVNSTPEPETKTITATFGATKYILNGENFDEQTMVYNGIAYLPAAYLATKLGLSAVWDSETNTTSLTSAG